MSKGRVYLAGSIAGKSGEQATGWRELAAQYFYDHNIEVRDPMRSKPELRIIDMIAVDGRSYADWGPFYTSKGILVRDFNDVKQSDVILVNLLGATRLSLGTTMEIAWAFALQKPIVCVMESNNIHDNHPMIHEAIGFQVDTLLAGLQITAVLLS